MSTTRQVAPESRVRFGHARVDITPPVGIYHRLWGAASHDRASGVHRPILADVVALAPVVGGPITVRVQNDLVCLVESQHAAIVAAVVAATGVAADAVTVGYSHSHSSGWYVPDRIPLPGGELIAGYLANLYERLGGAARAAVAALTPATITYATGRSAMAANRDYWDAARGAHACGFNPDAPADETVVVGRVTSAAGQPVATLVNYACHPTSLAWENSRLSPDYIGALRATVERETGAACVFFQGASGDQGPRHGFVGDVNVADRNGRMLGFAVLATLEGMGPEGTAFEFDGPVVSGATLGAWSYHPVSGAEQSRREVVAGGRHTVDLPLKERPDPAWLRGELASREAQQRAADAAGDTVAARDHGAHAERARRWLARIADLGAAETYLLGYSVWRFGDAVWVTCGGEPYSLLQTELRRRFPDTALMVSPLDGNMQVAYMLPRERYGRGLYQEEPSSLAPGCLEGLIDAIAQRVAVLLASA